MTKSALRPDSVARGDHRTLTSEESYADGHLTRPAFVSIAILTIITFVGNFTQLQLSSALPDIVKEFHISLTTGQWLTSIVQLVMAIMVPCTAFLTERFSTRQIVLTSTAVFALGSVLAWLSPNFALVLVGRTLEAVGSGVMWPVLQIVIFDVFPLARRGTAMGTVGMAISIAPAIGPTFGGWQADTTGWRSIFLTLAVISALVLVWAAFGLRNFSQVDKTKRADFLSIALSIFGFGGIVLAFTDIESNGIGNPATLATLAVGIIGVVWFVARQLRQAKRVKAAGAQQQDGGTRRPLPPLLDLNVFRNTKFTIGTILNTLAFFAFSSVSVILPLYIQNDRGYSATMSGLILLPGALFMLVTQLIGGRMLDRHGARVLSIIGMALLLIGTAAMSMVGTDDWIWWVSIIQVVRQLGIGMVMMPLNTWALNYLKPEDVSAGSSVINTAKQLGGAIGATVLVSIMEAAASARQTSLGKSAADAVAANVFGVHVALYVSTAIAALMLIVVLFGVRDTKQPQNTED